MSDRNDIGSEELASLVKRLDRQRRARLATESISEQATRALYVRQQYLPLLQAAAVSANESGSFPDSVQAVVDQICVHLHWPVGHVYLPLGTGDLLTLAEIWYLEDLSRFETFRHLLEQTAYSPEKGLAGKAVTARGIVWTSDLSIDYPPAITAAASERGLHRAIAFPVMEGNEVAAILEFFFAEGADPDAALTETLSEISKVLGQRHVRAQAEVTLRNSEEQYRLLFEANPNPMWVYDVGSLRFLAVNSAAVEQYGYSPAEFLELTIRDIAAPGEEEPEVSEGLMRHRRRDGASITVEITSRELKLPGRRGRLVMAVDVTDWRRSEEALRQSERRFRDLLDNVQLAAVLIDVVGTVTYCNPHLLALSGFEKQEVIGRNWFDLFVPEPERTDRRRSFVSSIGDGRIAAHDESEIGTKRGERRLIGWNHTVLRNAQGSVLGAASIGADITEQRRAERQLLYDAFHDGLTGLPNRALFLDRVSSSLSRARRDRNHCFAVLMLDIDRFKVVNDSLGHAAGDELLAGFAARLTRSLRAGDTVARVGGDEFTIMVESIGGVTEATRAAVRVQEQLVDPFVIDGEEIFANVSIGIAVSGPEYDRPEQLIRDADTAMYRAKGDGKGRYEIFDAAMREEAVTLLQIETDLRRAIDRGELRVYYQPIVVLETGVCAGFEALIRWQHPTKGLVPPGQFISLAEDTGLIVPIGAWVLGEACAQTARWRAAGADSISTSVNISSRQFSQTDLVQTVEHALATHGLPGSALNLEITESVLIQHAGTALKIIERLQALGVTISVDDFGTGYSSLSYLQRYPIDKLKIDSSFVRELRTNRKTVEITRTIVQLANNLGMTVIAEGIEHGDERLQLIGMQCGLGQGYLFSRAIPGEEAGRFVVPEAGAPAESWAESGREQGGH
jgi:diguanylate cyclase (GGDEF)-like protein/PAS domain S-box-containing protein